MSQSQYRARQVGAKTHEVMEYHQDDEKPGKPLHLLVPGGLVALATLALIVYIAYRTWLEGNLAEGTGLTLLGVLSPFYVGGVFLFSYGYELYNVPRALRLTAIIVFITLAAVVILAVLFFLLGETKGGSSSSKSSSGSTKGSSSKGVSSSSKGGGLKAGAAAVMNHTVPDPAPASASTVGGGSDIFLGGGSTRVVTREVVKEVAKEPTPIQCPFCARAYIPANVNFICPSCGAATPRELIEASQAPGAAP